MNQAQLPHGTNRELQLELARVRAEAAAARLEARAAEIELILLALQDGQSSTATAGSPLPSADPVCRLPAEDDGLAPLELLPPERGSITSGQRQHAADALVAAIRQLVANQSSDENAATEAANRVRCRSDGGHDDVDRDDGGWDARLSSLRQRMGGASNVQPTAIPIVDPSTVDPPSLVPDADAPVGEPAAAELPATALDGNSAEVAMTTQPQAHHSKAPVVPAETPAATHHSPDTQAVFQPSGSSAAKVDKAGERRAFDAGPASGREPLSASGKAFAIQISGSAACRTANPLSNVALRDVQLSDEGAVEPERRRLRPAAWLTSTVAHIVIFLVLGLMTLSAQNPRDQLAFSAAVSEASEMVVETFTIESSETPEDAQNDPTEQTLEISPLGVIPVAELALDLPTAPSVVAAEMLSSRVSAMSSVSQVSLKGDTASKVQFAGVEGGGNHFIYLVDSSKSMRNFNEARSELLRSVEALQPHQRFYVVFYDQDPDYMRLSSSNVDEPTSALATDANKRALRRWAMSIQQETGKSPIDVLSFAFKLRPDVIFLLSDGEFTARTEEVIREQNRRDNLFGEDGPISIIHTIRYPGYSAAEARSAEVQMKRIAEENGGQYRNIVIK